MTKTVTIAATRTGGEPYAHHDVIVTLVAGSAGGVVGSNVIVEQSTVKLDADGEGSVVLHTNDVEITSPATSFYRFTVEGSSPTITRSIRLTDDLPSTVSWTLADIQVGDPTIPQRDVSSNFVTMPSGDSLTNELDSLGDVFTVPMRGQWNASVDQVISVLAEFSSITPTFPTPLTDVDIIEGTAITGDVTVADIPTNWRHAPVPPVPEAYIGFNLPTSAVEGAVGFDQPFWGRLRYVWASGWTATVYIFYRDGIPADSTSDVRVVVISGGRVTDGTVPAAAVGETGTAASFPFTLSPEPPTALQWIVTADTVVTGREDLIFLDAAEGTTLTVDAAEPPDGTKLTVVTGANAGVFEVDGETIWNIAADTTPSSYALPALSVVVLARVNGTWAVLSDSSTGGGGGGLDEAAVQALIDSAVSALLDGAPGALDTLNELAAAINDDASFAASVTTALAGKADASHNHAASAIASGTLDIARIPTGTTSTTVPFGNDSRFSDKVPLSTVDAAGDLLIGTANDTVGRLPIGTARKVLTSDGTTAAWANAGGPSPAMYPVAVGQWFASPHEAIFAQATTLNRVLYVPVWVPADVTAVDGIQIEVTTVGSTGAVVRLGLHLPHATTKFPDARVIDGGTVDATSGGGAAGVRSLTIASTAVTPNSLIYVSVVSQGATATLRYANSGLWLLAMGVPSATNTDCMKASPSFGWFEAGVSGGFGTTASPTYSSSTAAQVVVGLRRA